MAIAIITRGRQAGRRLTISQWPASIGRDSTATVPLDDERSSRFHARIKKRDRLYILEDLQSKNGTYLNGDRVSNSIINSGDKILVGDTEIVFLTPEAQIDVATELAELEHLVDIGDVEDIGGSIAIADAPRADSMPPARRLDGDLGAIVESFQPENLRSIISLQSHIIGHDNIADVAGNALKAAHHLMPSISRSAMFVWNQGTRKLLPASSRHSQSKERFHFSKRAFESVLARKQGLLLQPGDEAGPRRIRVILPVVHLGQILCVAHLECDSLTPQPSDMELAAIRYLLEHIAPGIDAILLRQDLDHYSIGMIEAMIATLEAKDTYTHGHSERVSRYSMAIGDMLNLNRDVKRLLLMSSLCHDIGKIGIPDAILRKAALLNPDEYEEMKQHPVIGSNIVSHLPNARRFLGGIRHHHEKWDGTGYPDGLAGEDIPFFGRIVAVADVFDAMVSGRSYSGFVDESDAVDKMSSEKDLFDPDIIRAFVQAWQSGRLTQKTSTRKNKDKPGDDT